MLCQCVCSFVLLWLAEPLLHFGPMWQFETCRPVNSKGNAPRLAMSEYFTLSYIFQKSIVGSLHLK